MSDSCLIFRYWSGLLGLSVVPLQLASIRLYLTGLVARAHRQTVLHVHPSESDALPVSAMSRVVQLAGTQQLAPLINRMLIINLLIMRSNTSSQKSEQV